ncbi:LCP family protein [Streptomyces sp. Z26]|uniref:LCP family protein n=1 Tax=Streptomyces sp. Z26 TaxID=2500177 RepID=UPI000EF164A9|nr:LCP family protein [Streptomyces sp. Z26]RLL70829.1 LytR family transcriptional regulator [Streptomyces sp. Z26]
MRDTSQRWPDGTGYGQPRGGPASYAADGPYDADASYDAPHPAPGAPRPAPRRRGYRRLRRRHPVRTLLLVLLAVLLATPLTTYAWADTRLNRDVDLGAYGHRPPPGEGTTYLVVGSDSRAGLSPEQQKDLHTGGAVGRRTDSMILLHTGASGTTMVSLPRDSWVTVPSYVRPSTGKRRGPEKDKLNAAFAAGGPELLARTVEFNTGLRIDHYAEIGFAGFVNIVDSVGGVGMCLDRRIRDEKSGADLRAGCQKLDGTEALAFVRQRHQEKEGDLGRTLNQQRFLSALAHEAATADTVLNPATLYPALSAGLDTLVVDEDMGLPDLVSMVRAVQGVTDGKGERVNVPVSGVGIPTRKGSAIRWDDRKARQLFARLRSDRSA